MGLDSDQQNVKSFVYIISLNNRILSDLDHTLHRQWPAVQGWWGKALASATLPETLQPPWPRPFWGGTRQFFSTQWPCLLRQLLNSCSTPLPPSEARRWLVSGPKEGSNYLQIFISIPEPDAEWRGLRVALFGTSSSEEVEIRFLSQSSPVNQQSFFAGDIQNYTSPAASRICAAVSRVSGSGGLLLPPRRLATASWCLPALARAAATISGPSAGAGSSSATSCLQRSTWKGFNGREPNIFSKDDSTSPEQ